jgi:hypothetical protein
MQSTYSWHISVYPQPVEFCPYISTIFFSTLIQLNRVNTLTPYLFSALSSWIQPIYILSRIWGCVTNNNGFCIWWLGLLALRLQLQSIITVHTLNCFWTTCVWWISMKESLKISHRIKCTNALPFITSTRPECKSPCRKLILLCYSVCCHRNLVFSNLLPSNVSFVAICCSGNVISSRCSATDVRSGSNIPAFRQCLPSHYLELGYSVRYLPRQLNSLNIFAPYSSQPLTSWIHISAFFPLRC